MTVSTATAPRRFAAALVDWAVTFGLSFVVTAFVSLNLPSGVGGLTGSAGRLVLVWLGLVWLAWVALALTGRGLGGLAAGVRVVERGTGGHLSGVRALQRATVQIVLTSLVVMLAWLIVAVSANGLAHDASSGWYALGFVVVALSPATAEAFFSLLNSEHQAPWDRAANSVVIATRRHR